MTEQAVASNETVVTLAVAPELAASTVPGVSPGTVLIRIEDDSLVGSALAEMSASVIALDTETTGLDPINDRLLLVQLSDGVKNIVFDMTRVTDWQAIRRYLASKDHLFLAHNALFDLSYLFYKFQDANGLANDICPRLFDTMVAEQLLTAGQVDMRVGLAPVAERYLRIKLDKSERQTFIGLTGPVDFTDEQLAYAAKDVEILPRIFQKQAKKLQNLQMIEIAQVEFNLIKVIARMQLRGVLIDTVEWQRVVDKAKARCAELETEIREITGKPTFNPRSPKQIQDAFREAGFILPKTDEGTLKRVEHPLAKALLEYRKTVVLRDRYGDGWLARLGTDNRVRAQFRQLGAATGRFSSSDPNLQQLPRGDLLRKAFIAGPGRVMVTADYSQIEARLLAELSGDTNMINMFKSGFDLHAATAQQMFQLPALPGKDSIHRQMAKSVNFGLIYGAGPDNLRGQLAEQGVHVTKQEAEGLIRTYFATFPQAQKWLDQQARKAYAAIEDNETVMTRTIGGRVRQFAVHPGLSNFERGHIARQSKNSPIQGGSADVTKEAMIRLDAEFLAHPEWSAHLLMTVHDELVAEGKAEFADKLAHTVEQCMIDGAQRYMKVCPVAVDVKVSDHWSK